jgi:predicted nucleotidyltransferase
MIRHGIELQSDRMRDFCRRHGVSQLFVFGSILRDDFGPESDVDFLVRLKKDQPITLRGLVSMEDDLSALIGRPVDMVLSSEIDSPDANPYRRRQILSTMETIYAG